ncbi:MAG: hypothetical protein ACLSHO_04085 [Dysosmobacter sp.]
MKIGCVVLAAGNARRFGSNKLAAAGAMDNPHPPGYWKRFPAVL